MNKLMTIWGESLNPAEVLQEYPRPQLRRESYINLNGYWECAITSTMDTKDSSMARDTDSVPEQRSFAPGPEPEQYDRRILVPFCPESELSGIGHVLQPQEQLWYRRTFPVSENFDAHSKRLLLHFGAVDQEACVWINGYAAGGHKGGYIPFTLDITEHVHPGTDNELKVCVRDLTDSCVLARGKQKLKPGGMFYTPVSGIWQTVWLEEVPRLYVEEVRITPVFDESRVEFAVHPAGDGIKIAPDTVAARTAPDTAAAQTAPDTIIPNTTAQTQNVEIPISITVFDGDERIAYETGTAGRAVTVAMPDFKTWSPESPHLYNYELRVGEDCVSGYFAMRKFSVGRDETGILRLMLNNRPYFQNGLLDQGYWPDGLYTAPSDEALVYDIEQCRAMGFNMLRKHAKIEPLRWYYHCDRLGMIVWQDIVNGGEPLDSYYVTYRPTIFPWTQKSTKDTSNRRLSRSTEESRTAYTEEMMATIGLLYNSPSVALWTLFNEGWGQFDSARITELARSLDSTRLLDAASGWFDCGAGDVSSRHIYFTPFRFRPGDRPVVLSEFGGYSLPVEGHTSCSGVYGYRKFKKQTAFEAALRRLYTNKIIPNLQNGLSAAVYTQVSDIEEEINGLMTYDRKVIKADLRGSVPN